MVEMHLTVRQEQRHAIFRQQTVFHPAGNVFQTLWNVRIRNNQNPLSEILKAGFF